MLALLRERLQVDERADRGSDAARQGAGAPGLPSSARCGWPTSCERVVDRNADAAAASRITIDVDAAPDLVIYGDAGLLERVFDNLVRNGIQYNHEEGTVTVTARVRPGTGEWVADQVVITVAQHRGEHPRGRAGACVRAVLPCRSVPLAPNRRRRSRTRHFARDRSVVQGHHSCRRLTGSGNDNRGQTAGWSRDNLNPPGSARMLRTAPRSP